MTDQQNDLVQYTVLECYKYEDVVKRLHTEKRLSTWLNTTMRREYIKMKAKEPSNELVDMPDTPYFDLLEDFKPYLTYTEQQWIKRYIQEGSYKNLERKTKIQRKYISQRINVIIEKCKKLKSTLY